MRRAHLQISLFTSRGLEIYAQGPLHHTELNYEYSELVPKLPAKLGRRCGGWSTHCAVGPVPHHGSSIWISLLHRRDPLFCTCDTPAGPLTILVCTWLHAWSRDVSPSDSVVLLDAERGRRNTSSTLSIFDCSRLVGRIPLIGRLKCRLSCMRCCLPCQESSSLPPAR